MEYLQQLPKETCLALVLNIEQWLAVADGIRQGRCNIKYLCLEMLNVSRDTEAVKAIASAIRLDHNLEHLTLVTNKALADEAVVALTDAMTLNQSLRKICLSVRRSCQVQDVGALGAPAYEAFCAMLRVNTSLVFMLSPFETAGADERLVGSRN